MHWHVWYCSHCPHSASVSMNVEHDEVNLGLNEFVVFTYHFTGLYKVLYILVYDQK